MIRHPWEALATGAAVPRISASTPCRGSVDKDYVHLVDIERSRAPIRVSMEVTSESNSTNNPFQYYLPLQRSLYGRRLVSSCGGIFVEYSNEALAGTRMRGTWHPAWEVEVCDLISCVYKMFNALLVLHYFLCRSGENFAARQ